ncbi:hypothetical protein ABTY61_28750 [Kitasatospora sp. NPDC096128]|uniref:hypothetical protein n=1 Tax=Kitasatospora sp. NPDC096128 TaxID=3155547 RepID=UPI0033330A58
MSDSGVPYDEGEDGVADEGWPCYLSPEVEALLLDPAVTGDVFSAIVSATVRINTTCGLVPGSTASERWPQQRRMPLGSGGSLGVAEYVIVADAPEPHCVITRVQLY